MSLFVKKLGVLKIIYGTVYVPIRPKIRAARVKPTYSTGGQLQLFIGLELC